MQEKRQEGVTCAILADRNAPLADRLRQLVASICGTVFLVADPRSLLDGARRLDPTLLILDLSFAEGGAMDLLKALVSEVPEARVVVLSLYDDPTVAEAAIVQGASAVVLKRSVGDDLLPAIEAVLAGGTFVSPGFREEQPVGHQSL
jgi:DNA-binding NarL/FixJ family response regulator